MNRTALAERLHRENDQGPQLQVAPMLDMAFQLLAFFIFTFQPPSPETRVDLYLPALPAALPGGDQGETVSNPVPAIRSDVLEGLDNDLVIQVDSGEDGTVDSYRLGRTRVPDLDELRNRLTRFRAAMEGETVRVTLLARDNVPYGDMARLIGACSTAGFDTIRLGGGGRAPSP